MSRLPSTFHSLLESNMTDMRRKWTSIWATMKDIFSLRSLEITILLPARSTSTSLSESVLASTLGRPFRCKKCYCTTKVNTVLMALTGFPILPTPFRTGSNVLPRSLWTNPESSRMFVSSSLVGCGRTCMKGTFYSQ